ncbi:MAG: ester cyclase, partial [Pseudomonadota bacterium]
MKLATVGPYANLTDYILGITFEIWESGQVEKIYDYYAEDCPVYTLTGVTFGANEVVTNTKNALKAFPDRRLLGDAVLWSQDDTNQYLSSHRITSPMTNVGDSEFGPATGKSVIFNVVADCVVADGLITEEWLVRDNYGIAQQLGFDPVHVAKRWAAKPNP